MNRSLRPMLLLSLFVMSTLPLVAQYELVPHRSMRDDYVKTFTLEKKGYVFGHAIWMERSRSGKRIKAKYFASGDVYDRYEAWRGDKDIISVSAGAYSRNDVPVGICVDNGTTVNKAINYQMDALVIVEAVGGVRVSDIENRNLYLASLGERIDPIEDKLKLLMWGEDVSATIFQTHLLAYDGELRLYSNSSSQQAKRGFQVLATNPDGEVIHLLFWWDQSLSLLEASRDVLATLQEEGLNVISIINLDRGSYDILSVYDDFGKEIHDITGSKRVSGATNLLVYYYE